jgi:hypothetical protein
VTSDVFRPKETLFMAVFETENDRWFELLDIASMYTPDLVPILLYARQGRMVVKRKKSGPNEGMLYISLAPLEDRNYRRWDQLNCGPGRKMYALVQEISLDRWRNRYPAA